MKKVGTIVTSASILLAVVFGGVQMASAKSVVPTSMPVSVTSGTVLGAVVTAQPEKGVVPTSMPIVQNGGQVLGATAYQFDRNLSLYSEGEDVRMLQKWLNGHGYPVAMNGAGSIGNETNVYGRATSEAVKKLQEANGFKTDGAFGPMTRAFVNSF